MARFTKSNASAAQDMRVINESRPVTVPGGRAPLSRAFFDHFTVHPTSG